MFHTIRKIFRMPRFSRSRAFFAMLALVMLVTTGFSCQASQVGFASNPSSSGEDLSAQGDPLVKVRQRVTTGPLSVSAQNPRYFMDRNGDVVYLTGSHFWLNFQNGGYSRRPAGFNYGNWLDFLVANNHNFFRLWVWEEATWTTEHPRPFYFTPLPYVRSGPGQAIDGQRKFDLTRFNDSYFKRLRARVKSARDRGIYVSIMLFDGWSVSYPKGQFGQENPWKGHPFNASNNINGIDGDLNDDNSGGEVHTLDNPAVTALQDAYVKKVIDTVNNLDNVMFEISNESNVGSEAWQYHMIDLIHTYEAEKGYMQHPVGMTVEWPNGSNDVLYSSDAEWISPNGALDPIPVADGSKVVVADTDHLCGICGNADWVWRSFTRGQNPIFMDQYNDSYKLDGGGYKKNNENDVALRKSMGLTLTMANCMDLSQMTPRGDLASSGYALANPSGASPEYLIYYGWFGGWVDLTGSSGELETYWLNIDTGRYVKGENLQGGSVVDVSPPFFAPAALYIRSTSAAAPASKDITTAVAPIPDSIDAEALSNLKHTCFNQ